MNTKKQGDMGVAAAIAHYTLAGDYVSVPLSDDLPYDLIVDKAGILQRVQCKTAFSLEKGKSVYRVNLRTLGGNRSWGGVVKRISSKDADLVFVLTASGECYEVPSSIVEGKSTWSLGKSADKFKVREGLK